METGSPSFGAWEGALLGSIQSSLWPPQLGDPHKKAHSSQGKPYRDPLPPQGPLPESALGTATETGNLDPAKVGEEYMDK